MKISEEIERLFALPAEEARREGMSVAEELRRGLNAGEFRAAEKTLNGPGAETTGPQNVLSHRTPPPIT